MATLHPTDCHRSWRTGPPRESPHGIDRDVTGWFAANGWSQRARWLRDQRELARRGEHRKNWLPSVPFADPSRQVDCCVDPGEAYPTAGRVPDPPGTRARSCGTGKPTERRASRRTLSSRAFRQMSAKVRPARTADRAHRKTPESVDHPRLEILRQRQRRRHSLPTGLLPGRSPHDVVDVGVIFSGYLWNRPAQDILQTRTRMSVGCTDADSETHEPGEGGSITRRELLESTPPPFPRCTPVKPPGVSRASARTCS